MNITREDYRRRSALVAEAVADGRIDQSDSTEWLRQLNTDETATMAVLRDLPAQYPTRKAREPGPEDSTRDRLRALMNGGQKTYTPQQRVLRARMNRQPRRQPGNQGR